MTGETRWPDVVARPSLRHMDIREIDLHDDDLVREHHRVVDTGLHVGRGDMPRKTPSEHTAAVRAPDSGERAVHLGAFDGDRLVGVADVYLFLLDNTEKAWLEVVVDPEHRRRGVGGALMTECLRIAEAEDRTTVLTDTQVPADEVADHPYRRFAERHGFSFSNVEVVRHLSLPIETALLDTWTEEAGRRTGGYRIQTHVGDFPDELAESLCQLLGQLAVDAPTGEVDFEEEVVTTERLQERYAMSEAMGREVFETVAVTPDGVVAAQSTLQVPLVGTDAFQWGTFVHRQHRGHRLGLAVKVANLRALQERRPHVRRVRTQNGETNGYMISINEQLGFAPVEASVELVRRT